MGRQGQVERSRRERTGDEPANDRPQSSTHSPPIPLRPRRCRATRHPILPSKVARSRRERTGDEPANSRPRSSSHSPPILLRPRRCRATRHPILPSKVARSRRGRTRMNRRMTDRERSTHSPQFSCAPGGAAPPARSIPMPGRARSVPGLVNARNRGSIRSGFRRNPLHIHRWLKSAFFPIPPLPDRGVFAISNIVVRLERVPIHPKP
jgi:hypothetical protein